MASTMVVDSAFVQISAALGRDHTGRDCKYDACEKMLSAGVPLSSVYALAAVQAEAADNHDRGPDSTRETELYVQPSPATAKVAA
jgi:hypothetical protein